MPTTTNTKILLRGSPFAWIQKVTAGALAAKWSFNNLQSSTFKLPKASSSSSSSSNTDIKRADGAVWQFPKTNLTLDGITELDITPAAASSDATGLGEITIVINEAAVESNSWTAMLADIKANKDEIFLVTIGTGFSYKAGTDVTMKKPEGYIHMIGKISNDIDQQFNENPTSITLTFVSYTNSGLEAIDLTGATFTSLSWKVGGAGKDISGIMPPRNRIRRSNRPLSRGCRNR